MVPHKADILPVLASLVTNHRIGCQVLPDVAAKLFVMLEEEWLLHPSKQIVLVHTRQAPLDHLIEFGTRRLWHVLSEVTRTTVTLMTTYASFSRAVPYCVLYVARPWR